MSGSKLGIIILLLLLSQLCLTLCDPVDCSPPGSSAHEDSPGKNTGVGCHFLLQGIFLTQGSPPELQADSLLLNHWGSPILILCSCNYLVINMVFQKKKI